MEKLDVAEARERLYREVSDWECTEVAYLWDDLRAGITRYSEGAVAKYRELADMTAELFSENDATLLPRAVRTLADDMAGVMYYTVGTPAMAGWAKELIISVADVLGNAAPNGLPAVNDDCLNEEDILRIVDESKNGTPLLALSLARRLAAHDGDNAAELQEIFAEEYLGM